MATALRRHICGAGPFNPAQGMLICLTGIDGSGKSTQAEKLVTRLCAAGFPARYVWAGRTSSFTRPFIQLGKARMHAPHRPSTASLETNSSYRAYMRAIRRLFSRRLARATWRQLTLAEHVLQIWQRVSAPLARGEIVVCDRYLYDTLVNQAVLFGIAADQFAAASHSMALRLVPRPTIGFWLHVPPDVALRRKSDIYDRQHLEARQPLYAHLARDLSLHALDATLDADALADMIWLQVAGVLHARAPEAALPQ